MDKAAGTVVRVLGDIPAAIWAVVLAQAVAFAVYQIHQDRRITILEEQQHAQDGAIAESRQYIVTLDERGTRRLILVEERQANVLRRLDDIDRRIYDIVKIITPPHP